jgi:hypothetical protein
MVLASGCTVTSAVVCIFPPSSDTDNNFDFALNVAPTGNSDDEGDNLFVCRIEGATDDESACCTASPDILLEAGDFVAWNVTQSGPGDQSFYMSFSCCTGLIA